MDLKTVFEYEIFRYGKFHFQLADIVLVLFLYSLYRVVIYLVQKYLYKVLDKNDPAHGRSKSFIQLTKYFLTVIFLIVTLEFIGFEITILLASSAALFVGLGLGVQQIFNDFVSGIILLFEGTLLVGDVVELDGGLVGKVKQIDLRTSVILTRDNISVIVPNSLLVSEKVINWSHNKIDTRFRITVGVAYESDLILVKKVLEEAASLVSSVSSTPQPEARFINFSDFSLDFELLFFSNELFRIEFVKSEIRFEINRLFKENKIQIPFPQQDVYIKNKPSLS